MLAVVVGVILIAVFFQLVLWTYLWFITENGHIEESSDRSFQTSSTVSSIGGSTATTIADHHTCKRGSMTMACAVAICCFIFVGVAQNTSADDVVSLTTHRNLRGAVGTPELVETSEDPPFDQVSTLLQEQTSRQLHGFFSGNLRSFEVNTYVIGALLLLGFVRACELLIKGCLKLFLLIRSWCCIATSSSKNENDEGITDEKRRVSSLGVHQHDMRIDEQNKL